MSEIVTVYAVFGSPEEADRIASAMIERRLAACANILAPCKSVYRWEGKVERSDEAPALFKTAKEAAPALVAAIADEHSYDVPAICVWPIENAFEAYRGWVATEVEIPR